MSVVLLLAPYVHFQCAYSSVQHLRWLAVWHRRARLFLCHSIVPILFVLLCLERPEVPNLHQAVTYSCEKALKEDKWKDMTRGGGRQDEETNEDDEGGAKRTEVRE
jgi:hypothetical protein